MPNKIFSIVKKKCLDNDSVFFLKKNWDGSMIWMDSIKFLNLIIWLLKNQITIKNDND